MQIKDLSINDFKTLIHDQDSTIINNNFVITKKRLLDLQEIDTYFENEEDINTPSDSGLFHSKNIHKHKE